MINIPLEKSVAVLSSYRTGSTALCDYIASSNGIKNFDEAFHRSIPDRYNNFLHHYNSGLRYVAKIMPDHVTTKTNNTIASVLNSAYKIRLIRRDVSKQIASFYICHMTQKWHYHKLQQQTEYSIPINETELNNISMYIHDMNQQLLTKWNDVDCTVYYEDLDIIDSRYVLYSKPSNYSELMELITKNDLSSK